MINDNEFPVDSDPCAPFPFYEQLDFRKGLLLFYKSTPSTGRIGNHVQLWTRPIRRRQVTPSVSDGSEPFRKMDPPLAN